MHDKNLTVCDVTHDRNLQTYKAPLESQAQDTSLFTSITNCQFL